MKNLLILLVCLTAFHTLTAQRNIVLIIADDLGSNWCGFQENRVDTLNMPNVRKLLSKGVRFSNAWANPVCSPTRAGILTGRYSFRTGVGNVVTNAVQLSTDEMTIPKLLKNANAPTQYAVANIGKWHLNPPTAANYNKPSLLGWDTYAGTFTGQPNTTYTNWAKVTNGVASTSTNYLTTETTNDAITWLNQQGNTPFFLWLALNAPHSPYHLPPDSLIINKSLSGTAADIQNNPKNYFKVMAEAMDNRIGKIVEWLEANNKMDNTDIIFIGDNGNTPRTAQATPTTRSKSTIYQEGIHVPFIISGPSVAHPNRVSSALVNVQDLFATIVELAGFTNWRSQITADKPVDSKSLVPILQNTATEARTWAYSEVFDPSVTSEVNARTIRNTTYKLIYFDSSKTQELYNLVTDPTETTNLLSRTLTTTEQTNYTNLCTEMGTLLGKNICTSTSNSSTASCNDPALAKWLQNTTTTGTYYVSGNSTAISNNILVNCQSVKYSTNWVYVATRGIPSYPTGPFLDRNPTIAADQNAIFKLPLNPVVNTGTKTATTGGNIGIFINGVALFDYRDGVAWNATTGALCGGPGNTQCPGGMGATQAWNRDAILAERGGFDCAKGHPANGNYHHHQNPSAFNLDVSVLSTVCNLYASDGLYAINSSVHSPLIGFAYDGFPIYGAYAYKNLDGTGGITRMKSGYQLKTSRGTGTVPSTTTYPMGYFREDYEFVAHAGENDYLDVHNGRFCKTPDYPNGIYCYFATVDANWNSAYPYVVGPTFYGVVSAAKVISITETVTICSPILPIHLLSFTGKVQHNNAVLSWVTASEANNSHFNIERSTDALHFEKIGTVKAVGNSSKQNNYQLIDPNMPDGVTYYRLQQVDFDGKNEYFKVISLKKAPNSNQFKVLPNPTADFIAIQNSGLTDEDLKVELYDIAGKLVQSTQLNQGQSNIFLNTETLYDGLYLLRIRGVYTDESHKIVVKK